jgi:16S rRNA (guanine966-N2)-methyltransferase
MRVIGGEAGGRKLKGPATSATRPMTDRTREAIFNSLMSLGGVDDATVLDLFAGTGALGIEALSRGAATCVFVDLDRSAVETVRQNLATVGFLDRAEVNRGEALSYLDSLGRRNQQFDLAFIAPPYVFDDWSTVLNSLPARRAVCESSREIDIPDLWHPLRLKKYGQTHISIIESERTFKP